MSKSRPATPTPATREEIDQALTTLTDAELVRLSETAVLRHRALGARRAGRNEGDLMSDALIAVLEGRRKWIKANVEFVPFLLGVMKSLASHIRTGQSLDAFDDIAPNSVNDEDDREDPVETPAPVDPERQLLACELDRQIREQFSEDTVALLVYESFLDRMKPADIQSCLGIDENEYHAAAKRLRRATRSLAKGGPR